MKASGKFVTNFPRSFLYSNRPNSAADAGNAKCKRRSPNFYSSGDTTKAANQEQTMCRCQAKKSTLQARVDVLALIFSAAECECTTVMKDGGNRDEVICERNCSSAAFSESVGAQHHVSKASKASRRFPSNSKRSSAATNCLR